MSTQATKGILARIKSAITGTGAAATPTAPTITGGAQFSRAAANPNTAAGRRGIPAADQSRRHIHAEPTISPPAPHGGHRSTSSGHRQLRPRAEHQRPLRGTAASAASGPREQRAPRGDSGGPRDTENSARSRAGAGRIPRKRKLGRMGLLGLRGRSRSDRERVGKGRALDAERKQ
jgi:hypothetical protein